MKGNPKKNLFILMILLNAGSAMAEIQMVTVQPFRIGAAIGYSFTGYRDEVEAPINKYLNTLTYIIDGNIYQGNFLHSFIIDFFWGNPKIATPYKGYIQDQYSNIRGNTMYALDYRLWGNRTFPGYLGGAFRTFFHYTGLEFFSNNQGASFSQEISPPTGLFLFSLYLHATQIWIIDTRSTLVLSAGYPILGYAVRPPYANIDNLWMEYLYGNPLKIITLGKFTSFHNYWAVIGDLKYQYRINKLLLPYAGFAFELSRVNFPRPKIDALFRLNTGIAFTF
jgi:hypothetical protein